MKSSIKRPITLFLAFLMLFSSLNCYAADVNVPSGTIVYLMSNEAINSKTATYGQIVNFRVRDDVSVDNKVVISAGTLAYGQITTVQKARGIGKPGIINIQLTHIDVEGIKVPVTANLSNEGEDKKILALVIGIVICLPVLALKGGEGEIPPGYFVTASIAKSIALPSK